MAKQALVHDLGHDGLNNNYHKNAMTTRAVTHNDISIQVSRTSPVRVAFRSCDEPICEDSDAEPLGIMVNNVRLGC